MKRKRKIGDAPSQKAPSYGSTAQRKKLRKRKRRDKARGVTAAGGTARRTNAEIDTGAGTKSGGEKGEESPVWSAQFPASMQQFFRSQGIKEPTNVQEKSWPALLRGKNLLSIAPTGTFLLILV